METIFLILLFIPYVIIRYFTEDHRTKSEKEKADLETGIRIFKQNKTEEALVYFTEYCKNNPKISVAWFYLGCCNAKLNNPHSALFYFKEAEKFDNTYWELYFNRGLVLMSIHREEDALYELNKAIWYAHETASEVLTERGKLLFSLNRNNEGLNDLTRAVELGDENASYFLRNIELSEGKKNLKSTKKPNRA